ncbi:MAG: hypothetical protein KDD60_11825 [Bdellovibrionales bacterium]|nr:hypothetical protein [Bdellovibrionales bacterium]
MTGDAQTDSDSNPLLEFFRSVAHDAKTPLNSIISTVGLLADSELDSEQQEDVQEIQRSAAELRRYMETIFAYAKLKTGNFPVIPYPSRFSRILFDVVNETAKRLAAREGGVVLFLDERLPDRFQGDIVRVEMLFANTLYWLTDAYSKASHIVISLEQVERSSDTLSLRLTCGVVHNDASLTRSDALPRFRREGDPTTLQQSIAYLACYCAQELGGGHQIGPVLSSVQQIPAEILEFQVPLPTKPSDVLLSEKLIEQATASKAEFQVERCSDENHPQQRIALCVGSQLGQDVRSEVLRVIFG